MKLFWMATMGLFGAFGLSDGKSMEPAATTPTLDGSAWVLSSLPGKSLVADATATARFEDGRVSGSDGCNRYSMPSAPWSWSRTCVSKAISLIYFGRTAP